MTREPTNAEIMIHVAEIKNDVKEIKTQTQKTNGRVSTLENWRWFIVGGLSIIAVVILPIMFLLIKNNLDK